MPPTLSVSADTLTERLVTVRVDEVVAVGSVGDELPPQATVTAVAMTVATKRAWGDLKICSPPTTTWVQTPILPLAGRGFNVRAYGSRGCVASHSRARRWASARHSGGGWMLGHLGLPTDIPEAQSARAAPLHLVGDALPTAVAGDQTLFDEPA